MIRIVKGILSGVAATAAMTAHQEISQRLSDSDEAPPSADPWESAPAPAQVAKLGLDAVGLGPVPPDAIPLLTQVMHWSYGSMWGVVYGVLGPRGWRRGPVFGLLVWATSYAQLVPLGVYEPPWKYPLRSIADEIGYHLTYGTALTLAFEALEGLEALEA